MLVAAFCEAAYFDDAGEWARQVFIFSSSNSWNGSRYLDSWFYLATVLAPHQCRGARLRGGSHLETAARALSVRRTPTALRSLLICLFRSTFTRFSFSACSDLWSTAPPLVPICFSAWSALCARASPSPFTGSTRAKCRCASIRLTPVSGRGTIH